MIPNISGSSEMELPDGKKITVDDLVHLYREQAKTPFPAQALLSDDGPPGSMKLKVVWSSRDCYQLENSNLAQYYSVKVDGKLVSAVEEVSDPVDVSNILAFSKSPKTNQVAQIRSKRNAETGKEQQIIEILGGYSKAKSWDVEWFEAHGSIISKFPFASFKWSNDEKCLLYVAEHKSPKTESFYKFKKPNKSAGSDADNEPKPGHEFDYKEDWGEALETIVHTVVCVLNVETEEVKVVEVGGKSLAEPFFVGKGSSKIGFIAYDEEPRRLGLIYCPIRRNYVYTYDLVSNELTMVYGSDPVAVRSVRLSNDGNKLVFLENSILGPHLKASKLMLLNDLESSGSDSLASKATEIVATSIIGVSQLDALYVQDSLPSKCWTVDNKHVVFSCMSYNNRKVLAVNVDNRILIEIKPPIPSGATVLDLVNDVLVVSTSASNTKPSVMVGGLDLNQPDDITWIPAGPNPKPDESIFYSVDTIPSEVDKTPVYGILCSPNELKSKPAPCVVLPHGGPHSGFVDSYMNTLVLLSKLGFKSLLS